MKLTDLRARINASPKTAAGKRKFSKTLRKDITTYIQGSSQSLGVICRELEISVGTVHHWLKKSSPKKQAISDSKSIPITTVEEPLPSTKPPSSDPVLTLSGPSGFQLTGGTAAILEVWRHIHASNSQ